MDPNNQNPSIPAPEYPPITVMELSIPMDKWEQLPEDIRDSITAIASRWWISSTPQRPVQP